MTIITLDIGGQKLPDLIARARAGEEIVIAADDLPGSFFFAPLPEDEFERDHGRELESRSQRPLRQNSGRSSHVE